MSWEISVFTDDTASAYLMDGENMLARIEVFTPEPLGIFEKIAAAPDLLEAARFLLTAHIAPNGVCRECGEYHADHRDSCQVGKAMAAIARAEGR